MPQSPPKRDDLISFSSKKTSLLPKTKGLSALTNLFNGSSKQQLTKQETKWQQSSPTQNTKQKQQYLTYVSWDSPVVYKVPGQRRSVEGIDGAMDGPPLVSPRNEEQPENLNDDGRTPKYDEKKEQRRKLSSTLRAIFEKQSIRLRGTRVIDIIDDDGWLTSDIALTFLEEWKTLPTTGQMAGYNGSFQSSRRGTTGQRMSISPYMESSMHWRTLEYRIKEMAQMEDDLINSFEANVRAKVQFKKFLGILQEAARDVSNEFEEMKKRVKRPSQRKVSDWQSKLQFAAEDLGLAREEAEITLSQLDRDTIQLSRQIEDIRHALELKLGPIIIPETDDDNFRSNSFVSRMGRVKKIHKNQVMKDEDLYDEIVLMEKQTDEIMDRVSLLLERLEFEVMENNNNNNNNNIIIDTRTRDNFDYDGGYNGNSIYK